VNNHSALKECGLPRKNRKPQKRGSFLSKKGEKSNKNTSAIY
jgi:hypothetical protein